MSSSITSHVRGPAALRHVMVFPPSGMGVFEFVALTGLRAAQLLRGCVPTVEPGDHKPITIARMEVASGHIRSADASILSATET